MGGGRGLKRGCKEGGGEGSGVERWLEGIQRGWNGVARGGEIGDVVGLQ